MLQKKDMWVVMQVNRRNYLDSLAHPLKRVIMLKTFQPVLEKVLII